MVVTLDFGRTLRRRYEKEALDRGTLPVEAQVAELLCR